MVDKSTLSFQSISDAVGGLPANVMQQIEDLGITPQATSSGLKLVKDGEVVATVPLSKSILESMTAGKLGSLSKKTITQTLTNVVMGLSGQDSGSSPLDELIPGGVAKTTTGKVGKKAAPLPYTDQAATTEFVPGNTQGPTVPLAEATSMYQPVSGSDQGSVYFCVGISEDDQIKVAARYKINGRLSIRLEGPGLQPIGTLLSKAGITFHGKYASIHLDTGGDIPAAKCLGAAMGVLGVSWKTKTPNVKLLKGHGA